MPLVRHQPRRRHEVAAIRQRVERGALGIGDALPPVGHRRDGRRVDRGVDHACVAVPGAADPLSHEGAVRGERPRRARRATIDPAQVRAREPGEGVPRTGVEIGFPEVPGRRVDVRELGNPARRAEAGMVCEDVAARHDPVRVRVAPPATPRARHERQRERLPASEWRPGEPGLVDEFRWEPRGVVVPEAGDTGAGKRDPQGVEHLLGAARLLDPLLRDQAGHVSCPDLSRPRGCRAPRGPSSTG